MGSPKGRDLVIIRTAGAGKSLLAQALAVAVCRNKLSARYYQLADLADDIDAAADSVVERHDLLTELSTPVLLVFDDFLATGVSACALFQEFNLLVKRENSSTIIDNQHEPEYWYSVFTENALVDTTLSQASNNGSKFTLIVEDMRTRTEFQQERSASIKESNSRQRRKC